MLRSSFGAWRRGRPRPSSSIRPPDMPVPVSSPRPPGSTFGPRVHAAVVATLSTLVLAALGAHVALRGRLNLNWDEFNYLSKIHKAARGDLSRATQTFHVRLFSWLPSVSVNEVEQILTARWVMLAMLATAAVSLFLLGRRLIGTVGGLFAVLSTLTFSSVLRHGDSFRYDPILAAAFLGAACRMILRPGDARAAAAAGAVMALASLVSIKALLYAPSLGAALVLLYVFSDRDRRVLSQGAAFVGTWAAVAAVLYGLHAWGLSSDVSGDAAVFGLAAQRLFVFDKPFPQLSDLTLTLQWDTAFWALLALGAATALADALHLSGPARRDGLLLLTLAAPLGAVAVYRNSFPYFFVCVVPGASLLCGAAAARVEALLSRRALLGVAVLAMMSGALTYNGWRFWTLNQGDAVAGQRRVLDAIHEVFPEPVPYLDRCAMVSAYPMVGPFMSTFTMSNYRARKEPILEEILRTRRPRFVLANISGLNLARPWKKTKKTYRYLRADHDLLRAHYVRHWGPLWVAGKRFAKVGPSAQPFDLLIGGPHTVEAGRGGRVEIDGRPADTGSVVELEAGRHTLSRSRGAGAVTLRHGDHLPRPKGKAPRGKLFHVLKFRR